MKPRRSPRRTAPRKRDALARCVNDLLSANAHGPGNLDVPALRRLLEFPKPDADIVLRHVFDAINAAVAGLEPDAPPHYVDCLNCNQPLEAPAPDPELVTETHDYSGPTAPRVGTSSFRWANTRRSRPSWAILRPAPQSR